jgi:hypothetical protein
MGRDYGVQRMESHMKRTGAEWSRVDRSGMGSVAG